MVGRTTPPGLRIVTSSARREDDLLRERVRAALARPDAAPPERLLAEQLGVTRYRLRLAMRRLRESGELRPARREKALPRREGMIRATNPVEVIELRMVLEPALARLAAVRATPLDIARIERAATTAADQDQGSADIAFHTLVAAGSGNVLARDLYALLRQVGSDVRVRLSAARPACPNRVRQRDAEHRAIAAAIAARDADAAEAAMRSHLAAVRQRILDRLSPGMVVA